MKNEKRTAESGKDQQPLNVYSNVQLTGDSVKNNSAEQSDFPAEQKISFTLATKAEGVLTKRMKLRNGIVEKDGSECWMNKGCAETVTLAPEEFGPFLKELKSSQAIIHGVSEYDKAWIICDRRMKTKPGETPQTGKNGLPVISRTKDFFEYPAGPGLLMLDHDKARENAVALEDRALQAYSPQEFINIIAGFFPAIKTAARVSICSTSSCIYDAATGAELRGKSEGYHLYLFPQNAADVPRFLNVLGRRLVLNGYGRVEFSRDGKALVRTLADLLVGSPERLDFVAGAICDKGLEQRLPDPDYQSGGLLNTEELKDLTPGEEKAYRGIIERLKEEGRPTQATVKAAYRNEETAKLVEESGGKISEEQAREIVEARQNHILADDDLLYFAHLNGPIIVAHTLGNGPKFDNKSCADPLEPEYDGNSRSKARFYWNDGNPIINSYAHGGIKYRFGRNSGEKRLNFDAALPELIERTKTDCGAPFEQEALNMLARLKAADKSRFMRVRKDLKDANNAVVLAELNRDIQAVSREKNKFNSSSSSYSSVSITYSSLCPALNEKVYHIQRGLIIETEKGDKLAPHSEAAVFFARTLQGIYAFSEAGMCWYRFDECYWRKCSTVEFDEALTALLFSATDGLGFNNNYQRGVGQLIYKCGQNRLPEPLRDSIPFQNGLLIRQTGELLPVTPDNAHTWVLPFDYSAEADCPNFLQWLNTALDNDRDSVKLLQAWFNALLTGRPDLQIFLHLVGPAGTGKSTLGRIAFILVGDANATTTTLKQLEINRFETANIFGKRLTAIEEADKYGGSVTVLKAMTGQDPLRLERKNQQQGGSFIYEGQTIMMSNERLATTDYTSGIERRRITVEFRRRITPEERTAWEKRGGERAILHNEAPGIINWALQLSHDEVTEIFKAVPERVRRANLDAARFNNPVLGWMVENLLPDPPASVQIGMKQEYRANGLVGYKHSNGWLYPNYLTWCRENGRESVSLQKFSASVIDAAQTLGVQVKKKRESDGTKISGLRIRRDGERSWLEELENDPVQNKMHDSVQDNKPKVYEMKNVKGFATTSGREIDDIPPPEKEQIEVEF